MKRTKNLLIVTAGVFLLLCPLHLDAQSFSGWMGDHRNGRVDGFRVPQTWPAQLTKEWELTVGQCDASPVLSEGKIYLHVKQGDQETALCIDARTGKELWSTALNQAPVVSGPAAGHPGPRSTPYISAGKLITLGAGGVVNCVDATTGKIIWSNNSYTEVPQFYTGSSPLVIGELCILQLGGQKNGVLVALDVDSGEEIWNLQNVPCTYSSPVYMMNNDLILVQSENDLFGVSLKGELLWTIPTPVQQRFYNAPTPVYSGNVIIVAGQGGGTRAFSLARNGTEWETSLLWTNSELGTSFNTPLIKEGYLYAHEGRLGKLFCLDMKSGERKWQDETTLNRFASILDLGQVLASLTANGVLMFYEPNGAKYVELATYDVTNSEVYAHPVFAGDKLYIKDKETLTCWSF